MSIHQSRNVGTIRLGTRNPQPNSFHMTTVSPVEDLMDPEMALHIYIHSGLEDAVHIVHQGTKIKVQILHLLSGVHEYVLVAAG